jgi:type II secretory ATPase GspE/PulE/Tfp pilus assembly ATPase PilB-like protein
LSHPQGCEKCRGLGYLGRTGIFEVAIVDESVAAAITQEVSELELRQLLRSKGTLSLLVNGLRKVCDGTTSLDEVLETSWM